MLTLTDRQAQWVKMKLEQAEKSYQDALGKLVKAAHVPGETAYQLGWNTADLAYQDLLRRELAQMVKFTTDEECKATLENMEEWYTKEVLRWTPEHSTNPVSNLVAEMKHRAYQEMRELCASIKER